MFAAADEPQLQLATVPSKTVAAWELQEAAEAKLRER
jgi:hypothetical protein